MIDRHGNVKPMDFGVVRSMQSGNTTGAGIAIGTPAYMSPEQAEAARRMGAATRLAGLTSTRCSRASPPSAGTLPCPSPRTDPGASPAPREHEAAIPEYLEQTILRCIETPSNRFQRIAELDDALAGRTSPLVHAGAGEAEEARGAWSAARKRRCSCRARRPGALATFAEDIYPITRMRLQVDSGRPRPIRAATCGRCCRRRTLQKARAGSTDAWVTMSAQRSVARPSRLLVAVPLAGADGLDAEVKGLIEIDHEGKLRSFRRHDPPGATAAHPGAGDVPRPCRGTGATLLGFDTPTRPEVRDAVRRRRHPYLHVDWTATQPDEVYRSATVDLSANGVRALGTSYADYVDVICPPNTGARPSGRSSSLFCFFSSSRGGDGRIAAAGSSRHRRRRGRLGGDGPSPDRRLPAAAMAGAHPSRPGRLRPRLLRGRRGADTLLSLWPQKVMTWSRPIAGRWLGPRAAVSVPRGTLWGLAFLTVYVLLTTLAAGQGIRLRHWLPNGPRERPEPRGFLPHRRVRDHLAPHHRTVASPWPCSSGGCGLPGRPCRHRLLHHLRVPPGVLLTRCSGPTWPGVPGLAWFAWCFNDTDLLATIVAMFVFNGVVGTWPLRLNLDVYLTACLLAFAALAALPGFALVSLRQAAATTDSAGAAAHTNAFQTTRSACAAGAPERRAGMPRSNRPCGLTTSRGGRRPVAATSRGTAIGIRGRGLGGRGPDLEPPLEMRLRRHQTIVARRRPRRQHDPRLTRRESNRMNPAGRAAHRIRAGGDVRFCGRRDRAATCSPCSSLVGWPSGRRRL